MRPLLFLLLLQRARSNMVPFNIALEANNLGWVFDLYLALLLVVIFGLALYRKNMSMPGASSLD
jgi:hypothetical protein